MKVVVSGGAGQLGSFLCRAELDAGNEVVCLDNLSTGRYENMADLLEQSGFSFRKVDVADVLPSDLQADFVYHLASPASPPEYMQIPLETLAVNSQGTWNLLRLAEANHARFVFASTSEVYGDPAEHPQREEYWGHVNPNGVRSCYDESKRFGEALVASYARHRGVNARMVRIFNTYGPYSRPEDGRMVPNFVSQALQRKPLTIYGDGSKTRSLCFVTDTVRGIMLTMKAELKPGEVINLGNPEEHTVADYAQLISEACGVPLRCEYRAALQDDPARRRPDITRAKTLLGWTPEIALADGLGRTVEWFRQRLGMPTAVAC